MRDSSAVYPPAKLDRLMARGGKYPGNSGGAAALLRVMRRLQDGGGQYFGASRVQIEPVSYAQRPYSQVFRVRIQADAAISYAYIKVFKLEEDSPGHLERMQKRVARDYAATERVYRGLAGAPGESAGGNVTPSPLHPFTPASSSGLSAVRPIACFPEDLAIITQEAPGDMLDDLLKRQAAWRPKGEDLERLKNVLARVGSWVRAFQSIGNAGERLSLEDMRQYLDVRLVELAGGGCAWFAEGDREKTLRCFDALSRQVRGADLIAVPIHADLSPGNILVDGETITVLDFTMMKTGALCHDLAHLYLHIERLKAKPWFRPEVTDALQKALLRGFAPLTQSQHPLFKLLLLQHTVCHLLQLATPAGNPLARLQKRHLRNRDRKFLRGLIASDFRF